MLTIDIVERINIYICEYGCVNVTVDVDKGLTPFMIPCNCTGSEWKPLDPKHSKNGKCTGLAKSLMYPRAINMNTMYPTPTHEWYRPNLLEYSKLSDKEKQYVRGGGLLLRERTNKIPIFHGNNDDDYVVPNYDKMLEEDMKSDDILDQCEETIRKLKQKIKQLKVENKQLREALLDEGMSIQHKKLL